MDQFRDLERAATSESNHAARMVLMSAEENAHTTVYEERAAPETDLCRIALSSICWCDGFEACADWFEAHGYRW